LGGNEIRMNGDAPANYAQLFNYNDSAEAQNKKIGRNEAVVEDLEDSMPGVIPTISNTVSNHVALANGHLGGKHTQSRAIGERNGHLANGRPNFRTMLEDAEMDSHI